MISPDRTMASIRAVAGYTFLQPRSLSGKRVAFSMAARRCRNLYLLTGDAESHQGMESFGAFSGTPNRNFAISETQTFEDFRCLLHRPDLRHVPVECRTWYHGVAADHLPPSGNLKEARTTAQRLSCPACFGLDMAKLFRKDSQKSPDVIERNR